MGFKRPKNVEASSKDNKVVFDDKQHAYTYNNQRLISVTQFIESFVPSFQSIYASINKAKKNIKVKHGITDAVKLRKYWKLYGERASNLGTATHVFAELYILDRNTEPKTKYEEGIIKAINKLEEDWEIIAQEEILYSEGFMIAGTADLKLKNKKTKEYGIGDWKTTTDMHKSYNMMEEPFNIKDSAVNRYSIQLDIYSIISKERIPEKNRIVIKVNEFGDCEFFTPYAKDKEHELPFTLDKTMKALTEYRHQNKII